MNASDSNGRLRAEAEVIDLLDSDNEAAPGPSPRGGPPRAAPTARCRRAGGRPILAASAERVRQPRAQQRQRLAAASSSDTAEVVDLTASPDPPAPALSAVHITGTRAAARGTAAAAHGSGGSSGLLAAAALMGGALPYININSLAAALAPAQTQAAKRRRVSRSGSGAAGLSWDEPPPPDAAALQEEEQRGPKCAICLEVMKEPSCGTCGHVFCRACLEGAVRTTKKCPTCRKNLQLRQVHRIYLT